MFLIFLQYLHPPYRLPSNSRERKEVLSLDKKDGCEQHTSHSYDLKGGNLLGFITWQWLTPLMKRGYNKPLELEDLPNISEEDQCGEIFERFYAIYKQEEVSLFRKDSHRYKKLDKINLVYKT